MIGIMRPLRARAQAALALAGVVGAAAALPACLPLDAAVAVKALLIGGAISALAWRWLDSDLRLGAANQITLLRAALVVLLAAMLGEPYAAPLAMSVVALASVAALLDGVDGWVARRSGSATAFGARFDMETDALLIGVLALLAWQWGKAGSWVLLAGLARYGFVAASRMLVWMRRPLPPSRRRRVVCVLQTATLIVSLAPMIALPASAFVAGTGLTVLIASFIIDIHWLARRARSAPPTSGGSAAAECRSHSGTGP